MKQVSFRMPTPVYQDYVAVATSRGVNFSTLLNWVVTDYRPNLLLERASNLAGMLRAVVTGLPQYGIPDADLRGSLYSLNEIVRVFQDIATTLATENPPHHST